MHVSVVKSVEIRRNLVFVHKSNNIATINLIIVYSLPKVMSLNIISTKINL